MFMIMILILIAPAFRKVMSTIMIRSRKRTFLVWKTRMVGGSLASLL